MLFGSHTHSFSRYSVCQPVLETIRLLVCAKGWAQISLVYYNPRVILLLPLVLNNLRITWLSVLKVYFSLLQFTTVAYITHRQKIYRAKHLKETTKTAHYNNFFFPPLRKIYFSFSFHVECIFVSFPVILFITGEAASAALPTYAWWTALPLQTLLHWEYLGGWMPQSDGNATPVTQSQVLMYFCEYFLSDVRGIGGTEPVILFRGFFLFPFSALEDLRPVTITKLSWWITSTRSGFLKWGPTRLYSSVWPQIICIIKLAPSLLSAGHSSDGGKDSGDHPQQLSWDRPPLGRWRAWLCPSPDNWTGPRLPGKESAGTHHLQLLLRTHRQAGEACTRGENICRNQVDVSSWQFSNKTCFYRNIRVALQTFCFLLLLM